jgi:Icc-related predicted phosphoesterase
MIIRAIADLHGWFPKIEQCDLLLICGDVVDLSVQSSFHKGRKWFRNIFKPWAEKLPCNKVLFIAGNHDICIYNHETFYQELFPMKEKVTFLNNELYDYYGIRIFGTPYCKLFGNWAYTLSDDKLLEKYKDIPEYCDILMSHDAPYGTTDVCLEGWNREHLGNKPLRDIILKKIPDYNIHGHLHSSQREYEYLGKTKVMNCSYVNEQYEPTWEPITIEL